MAATSQPISIASHSRSHANDSTWPSQSPCSGGSASSVTVHPAPIFVAGSFGSIHDAAASFGSRFYPACSPGQLLNPLDPNEIKCRISSSIDSEYGSLMRAFSGEIPHREDELCRNYSCCGQPLIDLHALVDHFEETHVVVYDHNGFATLPSMPNMPHGAVAQSLRSSDSSLAGALGTPAPPTPSTRGAHTRNNSSISKYTGHAGFDPDDMELDVDSPPSSTASSSQSASPESSGSTLPQSQRYDGSSGATFSPPDTPQLATPISPQSHIPTGPAAFDTTAVHLPPKSPRGYPSHASHPLLMHPYPQLHKRHSLFKLSSIQSPTHSLSGALNGYAGYSDYSSGFPGTIRAGSCGGMMAGNERVGTSGESSIPPSLLFGSTAGAGSAVAGGMHSEVNTPMTTPAQSRAPSPARDSSSASQANGKEASGSTGRLSRNSSQAAPPTASTTLSRPGASLLLNKPFKCPKPGCMKSYKQANGLKYHITHGQCSFTPPADLASVEGLSEREAERKLRPFCCQVPPCQRRYKNMNGLRYHYQHSGDHGAIGLALLASGNHDATKSHPSPPSISLDTNVAPVSPTTSAPALGRTNPNTPLMTSAPHAGFASAPATPASAHMPQLPGQGFAMQSQPASAYASPWGSPRSGSPYNPNALVNGAAAQPLNYAAIAQGQWTA